LKLYGDVFLLIFGEEYSVSFWRVCIWGIGSVVFIDLWNKKMRVKWSRAAVQSVLFCNLIHIFICQHLAGQNKTAVEIDEARTKGVIF